MKLFVMPMTKRQLMELPTSSRFVISSQVNVRNKNSLNREFHKIWKSAVYIFHHFSRTQKTFFEFNENHPSDIFVTADVEIQSAK